jgi:hypothetical protein
MRREQRNADGRKREFQTVNDGSDGDVRVDTLSKEDSEADSKVWLW